MANAPTQYAGSDAEVQDVCDTFGIHCEESVRTLLTAIWFKALRPSDQAELLADLAYDEQRAFYRTSPSPFN